MALGVPVAGAAAYSAASGTTVSPAYPASIAATDAVLLFVGQKPTTANGGTVTTPSGWTLRDELTAAGGYGATLGADTGNTNLRVYSWNTPIANQTGNLTVTLAGNNVSWAFIVRISSSLGTLLSYGTADGQRTTTPTSPLSIALTNGSTPTDFRAGDLAIWAMCIPTDVTTPSQFSAESITATGVTFGTAVELNEPDSTLGNDIGGYSAYATVTAGNSTTAPTVTATLAGTLTNVRGPVVLIRVREKTDVTLIADPESSVINSVTYTSTVGATDNFSTGVSNFIDPSGSVVANNGGFTGDGSGWAYLNPTIYNFLDNHSSQITITSYSSGAGLGNGIGPAVRASDSGAYAVVIDNDVINNCRIVRLDLPITTLVTIGNIGISTKIGDIIKLTAVGNVISVYRNNKLLDRVIDNTYSTGQPGIYGFSNLTGSGDDFVGSDIISVEDGALLNRGEVLVADTGSYTLTGNAATLTKLSLSNTLTAEVGSFSLVENGANLLRGEVLTAETQSYAVTSNNVNLTVNRTLTVKVFADEELFSDDFTGSAGLLGANYTQQGDANIRLDGLGNAHAVATSRGLAWPNTVVFSNDQYAEITITAIETGGNNSGVGFRVQTGVSPPIEQGYVFRTGNSGAAYTFAQYNTSSTNVNIITTTVIPQVGDRIRAVAVGSTQYFYVNNQLIAIGSSTSWSTGVPAIYGNGTFWKSDNFVAGNYGGLHLAGTYTTVKASRLLSCSTASYTLTLNDAILTKTALNSLTAESQSYSITSNNVNLTVNRTLTATAQSYAVTSNNVNLVVAKILLATVQTYVIASTGINFFRGLRVGVTAQAFTLTGPPINLNRGEILVADTRSYTLTRNDAGLLQAHKLVADVRSYAVNTSVTNLVYTTVGSFTLAPTSRAYTLTRNDAGLLQAHKLVADVRSYTLTRNDANLNRGEVLVADTRSYTLTRNDANLNRGERLVADTRSYTLTRNDANLNRGEVLVADTRSYTLTRNPAALTKTGSYALAATVQPYTLTRNAANLLHGVKLVADTRSYTLTRNDANLVRGERLVADTRSYTLTRNDANLVRGERLVADTRSYTLATETVSFRRTYVLPATTEAIELSGYVEGGYVESGYVLNSANLLYNRIVAITSVSYILTRNDALILRGGFIKVWTGSAWTPKPLKTWNGTAWVSKPLKVWTGSIWRTY
jgi:hypothetical protein